MTLLGLAIVGKGNEPLYLCDCERYASVEGQTSSPEAPNEDLFGFQKKRDEMGMKRSMPLELQFLVHSALDILEERMGPANPDGTMALRRGIEGSTPVTSRWAGTLFVENDLTVYGYVTATSIKIMAVARGDISEAQVKELLANVHAVYIRYIMNPMCSLEALDVAEIRSTSFDESIQLAIQDFKGAKLTI